jgi:hypothetical protein
VEDVKPVETLVAVNEKMDVNATQALFGMEGLNMANNNFQSAPVHSESTSLLSILFYAFISTILVGFGITYLQKDEKKDFDDNLKYQLLDDGLYSGRKTEVLDEEEQINKAKFM